ncbi:MAG: HK97 family phage prohead protease [Acidobacteria bacterium]|nr:HK97 family phage prohead protease [Acidobacteriota bacterium]
MDLVEPATGRVFRLAVTPLRDVRVVGPETSGDGSFIIEGYAAVFEQETVLYDGRWVRIREEIARGAFDNVLERLADGDGLVHLNFGHDMNTAIAASNVYGVGGLVLWADDHGLRFEARADSADPDAQRLAAKLRRGVVGQASFAFTIAREETEQSEDEDGKIDLRYRITEIGNLYDVCACPQGAYPQTESHLRSLAAASLGRSGVEPAGLDRRSTEGETGRDDLSVAASEALRRLLGRPSRASHALACLRARATVLVNELT